MGKNRLHTKEHYLRQRKGQKVFGLTVKENKTRQERGMRLIYSEGFHHHYTNLREKWKDL